MWEENPRPPCSLGAFEPLVQSCLSNSRHHLPYVLFLHHAFIAHEFFRRSCGNWSHADEDLGSNQMLECLQMPDVSGQSVRRKQCRCAAYRHQDLLAAAYHTNTTAINLDGSRLRRPDLFLKGIMQHLKRDRFVSSSTSMDTCDKKACRRV